MTALEGPKEKSTKMKDLKPSLKVGDLDSDELSGYNSGTSTESNSRINQSLVPAIQTRSDLPFIGQPYPNKKIFFYRLSQSRDLGELNDPAIQAKKRAVMQAARTGRVQSLPPMRPTANQFHPQAVPANQFHPQAVPANHIYPHPIPANQMQSNPQSIQANMFHQPQQMISPVLKPRDHHLSPKLSPRRTNSSVHKSVQFDKVYYYHHK